MSLYLLRLLWPSRGGRIWLFRIWARGVARIVELRIAVEGAAPEPPFLLVSNHLSYVDIVLLATQLDGVFVAKCDVRNWPILGQMIEHMDTIFIDRASRRDLVRVNDQIEHAFESGDGVVLFAEGTSTRGERVLPLKPSLLDLAARRNHPVSYASITYRTPPGAVPAHESVCWWGDMKFADHFFKLLKLPDFEARLVFGEEPLRGTDRKQLAHRLHTNIQRQFTPVVATFSEVSSS